MTLEVIDDGANLTFKKDGVITSSFSKSGTTLQINGNALIIKADNGETRNYDYTKVINPTYASVEAFRVAVEAMLDTAGGGSSATEAKQDVQITAANATNTALGLLATETTLATLAKESGGNLDEILTQVTNINNNTAALLAPLFQSDVFTTATSGSTLDGSGKQIKSYSIQVTATGAVTSWDVRLEVSLDGTSWTEVAQHTNITPADGQIKATTLTTPALYVRSRCAAIVLGAGTDITVIILAIN